jgi:hypothetical protein
VKVAKMDPGEGYYLPLIGRTYWSSSVLDSIKLGNKGKNGAREKV